MTTKPSYTTSPLFSGNTKSDIILRSSDGIDFYVLSVFLSHASPVFEDMLNIPAPTNAKDGDEIKDGLRVVLMSECSRILERMLLLCYPKNVVDSAAGPKLGVDNVEDAAALLGTLAKYEMAASWDCIRKLLFESPLVRAEPMRAFGAACRVRCTEMARLAARSLSPAVVHVPNHEHDPNYQCFSFLDLVRAQEYHAKCAAAADAVMLALRAQFEHEVLFHPSSDDWHKPLAGWWLDWFENVQKALHESPSGAVALEPAHRVPIKGTKCKLCLGIAEKRLPELAATVDERIEEAIGKVGLYASYSFDWRLSVSLQIELDFGW